MNLADAIRQAATNPVPKAEVAVVVPSQQAFSTETVETRTTETVVPPQAQDAATSQPIALPESPQVTTGNVVRLELFLNPEQLSNLFRAVSASQHSMMTLRETASYLRVNAAVLEQMAQDGEIPAFNIDGRWRFPKHGVDEWLTIQAFRRESA